MEKTVEIPDGDIWVWGLEPTGKKSDCGGEIMRTFLRDQKPELNDGGMDNKFNSYIFKAYDGKSGWIPFTNDPEVWEKNVKFAKKATLRMRKRFRDG